MPTLAITGTSFNNDTVPPAVGNDNDETATSLQNEINKFQCWPKKWTKTKRK